MSRGLSAALAATLLVMLGVRASDLAVYGTAEFVHVERSRWLDVELSDHVDRGFGAVFDQLPRPELLLDDVDRPELADRLVVKAANRQVEAHLLTTAAELAPALAILARRAGPPRQVFVVATDHPADRAFAKAVIELVSKSGRAPTQVRAHRLRADGSPSVASAPGDWILVAREASREHIAELLKSPGRKIFAIPPYTEAVRRPHPDLWFLAPWDPRVEYAEGLPVSSCEAYRHLHDGDERWPYDDGELRAFLAMGRALAPDAPDPAEPAVAVSPVVVGPRPGLRGPAQTTHVTPMRRCE